MSLAYLDAGAGAMLATVIASGAVGASAVLGSARRRVRDRIGRRGPDEAHGAGPAEVADDASAG
jgi:hypothetical protein